MSYRILVVDDDEAVLEYYRAIFEPSKNSDLDELTSLLGGDEEESSTPLLHQLLKLDAPCQIDYASQGSEAVERVEGSLSEAHPYAALLVDIRMPPGIDGLETATQIRQLDPNIQIFIVTAYSDYSTAEIVKQLQRDVLMLHKPLAEEEIVHFVANAIKSWRRLDQLLDLKWKLSYHHATSQEKETHFHHHHRITSLNHTSGLYGMDQLLDQLQRREPATLINITIEGAEQAFHQGGSSAADHLQTICIDKISRYLPDHHKIYHLFDQQIALYLPLLETAACKQLEQQIQRTLYFVFAPEMLGISITATTTSFELPEARHQFDGYLEQQLNSATPFNIT